MIDCNKTHLLEVKIKNNKKAKIKMSELLLQNPQELRPGEPQTYVQNPHKAELMASASKDSEEKAVAARNLAARGLTEYLGDSDASHLDVVEAHAQSAVNNKEAADRQAQTVSDAYEALQDIQK